MRLPATRARWRNERAITSGRPPNILSLPLASGAAPAARSDGARSRRLARAHLLDAERQSLFPARQRDAEAPIKPIAGKPRIFRPCGRERIVLAGDGQEAGDAPRREQRGIRCPLEDPLPKTIPPSPPPPRQPDHPP